MREKIQVFILRPISMIVSRGDPGQVENSNLNNAVCGLPFPQRVPLEARAIRNRFVAAFRPHRWRYWRPGTRLEGVPETQWRRQLLPCWAGVGHPHLTQMAQSCKYDCCCRCPLPKHLCKRKQRDC